MKHKYLLYFIVIIISLSCKAKHAADTPKIIASPEEMDVMISENIKEVLSFANENDGKINDSLRLYHVEVVRSFYQTNNFKNIWSLREGLLPQAVVLIDYLNGLKKIGLYPEDYHYLQIAGLKQKLLADTLALHDANLWTQMELLLTDGFIKMIKDVKEGRLVADSASIIHKQKMIDSLFIKSITQFVAGNSIDQIMDPIHPTHPEYQKLLAALPAFLENMDTTVYPHIDFPFKDSIHFIKSIYQRIAPEDHVAIPDSITFANRLRQYQKDNGLSIDGKAGKEVVGRLNENDQHRFLQIAITLDRYKRLPSLPSDLVWVNIPGFYLKVWENRNEILWSKVVVGKPGTPTPSLVSNISDMVTYPKWTIPESIVKKEILPQLKLNPGYLAEKGFNLFDEKGEIVDPYSVDWSKYNTGIPWKVVQGSGDDNALGVLKFNFQNPYSVYLHDTNQRYLFQNSNRALSHGCVRVEKWRELAFIITQYDREKMPPETIIPYNEDSIDVWIGNKSRKQIFVRNKLRLYIGYFTCSVVDGNVKFYKDIYRSDKTLAATYFPGKIY